MSALQVPTPGRVREVFEEVLSHPDFEVVGAPPVVQLIGRLWDAVVRFFERWFPNVGEEQVRAFSWILLGLTVAFLGFTAWRWVADRQPGRRARPAVGTARKAPRDAGSWARWARGEAAEGRLREAATGLYQAVILHLEAEGALRYGEWKTPGDYALETAGDTRLRGPFRGFLSQFVALAFGPVEPSPEALDSLFDRAEQLGCPS